VGSVSGETESNSCSASKRGRPRRCLASNALPGTCPPSSHEALSKTSAVVAHQAAGAGVRVVGRCRRAGRLQSRAQTGSRHKQTRLRDRHEAPDRHARPNAKSHPKSEDCRSYSFFSDFSSLLPTHGERRRSGITESEKNEVLAVASSRASRMCDRRPLKQICRQRQQKKGRPCQSVAWAAHEGH